MESEDIIQLPFSGVSDTEIDGDETNKLGDEIEEVGAETNTLVNLEGDAEIEEGQLVSSTEVTGNLIGVTETNVTGYVASKCEINTQIEEGPLISKMVADENDVVEMPSENGSMSGVKRMRMTYDDQEPSVHVKYFCLSRQSKQKLEELLREWSEWHVKNSSKSVDETGGSETGEGTYFPALDIGTEKTSTVSFWMENDKWKPENKNFMPMEDASVPLYDRGFALDSSDGPSNLEGGLELLDAPRCFNCGSYSHSLKECPKPRDNAAVNNSRKQLKSKRNQTTGMRNATRYYQDSPGGKYEGLRPGILDAETRRLLGLGEFDPPPWLNRMREIGYPPGYLVQEDENLPSGITIFADEETEVKEDKEDGEILEAELVQPPQKMGVEFPGINAPIPKDADERLWSARSSNPDRHRNTDQSYYSSESYNRGRHREHSSRDLRDDDPFGFERPSRSTPRYNDHEFSSSSYNSRKIAPVPKSPTSGRSLGDRGRDDPLDFEDSSAYRLYSSSSYNSSRRFSEHNSGSDGSRIDHTDYSSRGRDRDDNYRRHSMR
ncbi:unnamed protein product [Amaranthus hypochondriacus]